MVFSACFLEANGKKVNAYDPKFENDCWREEFQVALTSMRRRGEKAIMSKGHGGREEDL